MKNYLIGIALLLLAFFLMFRQAEPPSPVGPETPAGIEANATRDGSPSAGSSVTDDGDLTGENSEDNATQNPTEINAPTSSQPEQLELGLEGKGSASKFWFTSRGGAIQSVYLKHTERMAEEYNMKHTERMAEECNVISPEDDAASDAALSLAFETDRGDDDPPPGFDPSAYEYEQVGPEKVTLVNRTGGLEVRREYWRDSKSPYVIGHRTTVFNRSHKTKRLSRIRLGLGVARPIGRLGNPFDSSSAYLNVGYFNAGQPLAEGCSCAKCSGRIDGEEDEFFQSNEMGPKVELRKELGAVKWACVSNRFFVGIVQPKDEVEDALVSGNAPGDGAEENGLTGSLSFPFGELAPDQNRSVELTYYAGPKDFVGLAELGDGRKTVMQFGVFSWISEPLNWFLNKLRDWLGNFGLAIVVMTIVVKLVLWPLTAQATRSQKRMQALQEPMGEIKEKYKDDKQKLNQETMKFYKEHGVNPFAGCWPILIQMPIFLGMFWMLRSAAELYGQDFLWIKDLSEQDNVSEIGGYSLNLLPLLMVATQWLQMKLTPMQLGPSATDAQKINAKMMRMMPFMFLIFLYFFSSALVLYWTVQNIMSILQNLVTKKGQDPAEATSAGTDKPGVKKAADSAKAKRLEDFVDEEEREHRKVLGLKLRGPLKRRQIEEVYRQRIAKYHPEKLRNLGSKRQQEALEKREKLEVAYEFLLNKPAGRS